MPSNTSMKFVFVQPFIQKWKSVAFPLKKICFHEFLQFCCKQNKFVSSVDSHHGKAQHDMTPLSMVQPM